MLFRSSRIREAKRPRSDAPPVPVEWQEEIQRRVTERQEAEQAEPEETELEDAIAALKLLGVEAK